MEKFITMIISFISNFTLASAFYYASPYAYCLNNPINYSDPNGKLVRPCSEQALTIINNTLPKDAHQYIILDKEGYIDASSLQLYRGNSNNYNSLATLVESEIEINVTTSKHTTYSYNGTLGEEDFNPVTTDIDFADPHFINYTGNITGECGNLGVTYMPTNGGPGKADAINPNTIRININPSLSDIGAAETFSHEGYGHALIYVETGGDRDRAIHHTTGLKEMNTELINKILEARRETVKNMGQ